MDLNAVHQVPVICGINFAADPTVTGCDSSVMYVTRSPRFLFSKQIARLLGSRSLNFKLGTSLLLPSRKQTSMIRWHRLLRI